MLCIDNRNSLGAPPCHAKSGHLGPHFEIDGDPVEYAGWGGPTCWWWEGVGFGYGLLEDVMHGMAEGMGR